MSLATMHVRFVPSLYAADTRQHTEKKVGGRKNRWPTPREGEGYGKKQEDIDMGSPPPSPDGDCDVALRVGIKTTPTTPSSPHTPCTTALWPPPTPQMNNSMDTKPNISLSLDKTTRVGYLLA